jgi:signal transduction histidine kinase
MTASLVVTNLHKRFGTLEVLRDISFDVHDAEVVGLTGLSGSGKTVIASLLAGLYPANTGQILYRGQRLIWPFKASNHSIEVIHQTPVFVESLDVTENIFLGHEIDYGRPWRWLKIPNQARMDIEAGRVLDQLGVQLDSLREKVANLSNEQRQLVAIARAMVHPAQLLVIDEPTVLLSYGYQQRLLELIQLWQADQRTVIFCSGNLDHLFAVTDRILVLKHGQKIISFRTDETSREEIMGAMVGSNTSDSTTPAIWALDSYYRAREKTDQLYQRTSLLENDPATQTTLNQQLLAQLAIQVRALDQANSALQNAQRRLLTEREQERKHLARELHDQVIQDLLSTNYQLESVEISNGVDAPLLEQLVDIRSTIKQLIEDLRRICGNLRPPTIDSLGLTAAIQSYTNEWSKRTGITVKLRINLQTGRLPEGMELSIFRIVQEGLHNIHRHSHSGTAEIEMHHISPRTLMVSIADDGEGLSEAFDLSKLTGHGHYGLIGISERVTLLGGHLRISNRSGGGVMLQVEIPHPRIEITEALGEADVVALGMENK